MKKAGIFALAAVCLVGGVVISRFIPSSSTDTEMSRAALVTPAVEYTAQPTATPKPASTKTATAAPRKTATPKPEPTKTQYILNKKSKKFHKPSCKSVKDMSEKNKKTFYGTRQEVIDMGYSPCQNCHP